VQDVGQHQFLMLLLVMQADLDDRDNLLQLRRVGALYQPADGGRGRGLSRPCR
jgi:hypothetical protein